MSGTRAKVVAILFTFSWLSNPAFCIEYVDVLIGVPPTASQSISATDQAAQLLTQMPIVMADSGLTAYQFRFAPYPIDVNYPNEAAHDGDDAHDWLVNHLDSAFESARNIAIGPIPGFDILVMIVEDMDPGNPGPNDPVTCGATFANIFISNNGVMTFDESDRNRFAYIVLSDVDRCRSDRLSTFAHEFGHIASGEHQESGDSNPEFPVPYNHSAGFLDLSTSPPSLHETIMADVGTTEDLPQYSRVGSTFKAFPSTPAGHDHADMARLIGERWSHIAAYRPVQPPQACNLRYEFATCNGTIAIGNVTALLPGYTVTLADFDFSTNSGASWNDLYSGLVTCPGAPVYPTLFSRVRAILTTAYGVSQCEIPITINDCEGGGGGPNPF